MAIKITRALEARNPTVGDLADLIANLPRDAEVSITAHPGDPRDPRERSYVTLTVSGEPAKPQPSLNSLAHQHEMGERSQ